MLAQSLDNLHLLLRSKPRDGLLNDAANARLVHRDEAGIVHESEEAHDELAIHTISHATMTRNGITKVLNLKRALEARCEEATEGRDEGCKCRKDKNVELHGRNGDGGREMSPVRRDEREAVDVRNENRVNIALKASEDVGTEVLLCVSGCSLEGDTLQAYIHGADEVLVPHQNVGKEQTKDDGEDPRAKETFHRLLGRNLDQLGPAKRDAADVGKNVVRDDQRDREEEPDHSLENVVHDKVRLDHDEVQRHVRPCELGKLELVMTLLQRGNEEDES